MFTVGQKVYSPAYGWGTVTNITSTREYPMTVRFEGSTNLYTIDGKDESYHASASLFTVEQAKLLGITPPKVKKTMYLNVYSYRGVLQTSMSLYLTEEQAKGVVKYDNYHSTVKVDIED